ncbi:MAG: ATP-binding protein, partial [Thermomicrobiales bacterium]
LVLTGPGGVGKTRLAIASASAAAASFQSGALFVALAPIRDPALVAATIARAAGIRESGAQPASVRLAEMLADRELLLVLDNFEHLLPASHVIHELLEACPTLTMLMTSRTRPRLTGERDIPVEPLPLPPQQRPPPHSARINSTDTPRDDAEPEQFTVDVGAIEQSPAIRLFVDRACAIDPSFRLTVKNARAVAEICRRVDGLPLAIELAAARTQVLPPAALLARLDTRLPLLAGGPHDQPERLQTMRQAIAWSFDLLRPGEQRLFRRLAVFEGGFTLKAAEAVSEATSGMSTLDGVTALIDASLLRRMDDATANARYAMLETIREFGLERLAVSNEEPAAYAAHAAYCLALSEEGADGLQHADRGVWLARLEIEWPNLRPRVGPLRAPGRVDCRASHGGSALAFLVSAWSPGRGSAPSRARPDRDGDGGRTDIARPSAARRWRSCLATG